jgi:tubulin monoglycylase TTLL3/8
MLACQDTMDKRQNSFELYGADFMLTDDFTPWLIEINASPDLAPTTSVTARLCPQCLEDVVKGICKRIQYYNFLITYLFFCHKVSFQLF